MATRLVMKKLNGSRLAVLPVVLPVVAAVVPEAVMDVALLVEAAPPAEVSPPLVDVPSRPPVVVVVVVVVPPAVKPAPAPVVAEVVAALVVALLVVAAVVVSLPIETGPALPVVPVVIGTAAVVEDIG